jgi:hypothetical protein
MSVTEFLHRTVMWCNSIINNPAGLTSFSSGKFSSLQPHLTAVIFMSWVCTIQMSVLEVRIFSLLIFCLVNSNLMTQFTEYYSTPTFSQTALINTDIHSLHFSGIYMWTGKYVSRDCSPQSCQHCMATNGSVCSAVLSGDKKNILCICGFETIYELLQHQIFTLYNY